MLKGSAVHPIEKSGGPFYTTGRHGFTDVSFHKTIYKEENMSNYFYTDPDDDDYDDDDWDYGYDL